MEESQEREALNTFREEAVAHRARRQGPGGLVRLAPGWTSLAFYLMVGLVAVAVVAAGVVRIERKVEGATALDRRGRVVVLVPASLVPGVPKGNPVEIGARRAEVESFEGSVLYPPEIRRDFGVDVSVPSVVVVTSARGDRPAASSARVLIESDPLIVALVPGLSALLGEGDG